MNIKIFDAVDRHWKKLMWIPLIALALSLVLLAVTAAQTGFILERDIELTGGKQIIVEVSNADLRTIEQALPNARIQLIAGITQTLQVNVPYTANETEVIADLQAVVQFNGEPSVRSIGPVLGGIFFQQALLAFAVAFVLMSIVVFAIFRSPVPSGIVILSVIVDITVTMSVMNLLHVALSLPVLAALLTLIGYSVDTDILLTANMLRSHDIEMKERIVHGMKTGLTMTATSLAALIALYVATGSFVLQQIAIVLIIGLCVDVFATWFTNVGILRWYMERKRV